MRTLFLTALAMIAFAANSLLCRKALGGQLIDAANFTGVRLTSGAVMLWVLVKLRSRDLQPLKLDFVSSAMLFLYAVCFSFAYLTLSAGTGALILFAAVQVTMINFVGSVPLALVTTLFFSSSGHLPSSGFALAATSGAITSGLGYAIWYAALPGLTSTMAASVQLSVPVIAAFGGVLFFAGSLDQTTDNCFRRNLGRHINRSAQPDRHKKTMIDQICNSH